MFKTKTINRYSKTPETHLFKTIPKIHVGVMIPQQIRKNVSSTAVTNDNRY